MQKSLGSPAIDGYAYLIIMLLPGRVYTAQDPWWQFGDFRTICLSNIGEDEKSLTI